MSLMSRLKASLRLASSQLAGAHLTRFARDRFCSHFVSVMHGAGFRHLNSVADIRLRHVKVFLKNRLDAEASPRTICNQMSHLRNLLRVAGNVQISEQLNVSNRSLGIPQSTRLGSKVAINEIELAATLERVTCPNLKAILGLELALGLRAMEALRAGPSLLGWQSRISSGEKSIEVVYGTKGGRVRTTHLPDTQRALAAIKSAMEIIENDKIAPRTTLKKAVCWYRNLMHRLGIQGHRLRYAFARECVEFYLASGMPTHEVYARVSMDLGHGDRRGRWVKMIYCRQTISEIL